MLMDISQLVRRLMTITNQVIIALTNQVFYMKRFIGTNFHIDRYHRSLNGGTQVRFPLTIKIFLLIINIRFWNLKWTEIYEINFLMEE